MNNETQRQWEVDYAHQEKKMIFSFPKRTVQVIADLKNGGVYAKDNGKYSVLSQEKEITIAELEKLLLFVEGGGK